jgi:hypothetical protein
MKKFNVNKNALIYFAGSWIMGLLMLLLFLAKNMDGIFMFLIAITALNVIINIIVILLLLVFYYVFSENRQQFKNSALLLLFNFPNLIFLYFITIIYISL